MGVEPNFFIESSNLWKAPEVFSILHLTNKVLQQTVCLFHELHEDFIWIQYSVLIHSFALVTALSPVSVPPNTVSSPGVRSCGLLCSCQGQTGLLCLQQCKLAQGCRQDLLLLLIPNVPQCNLAPINSLASFHSNLRITQKKIFFIVTDHYWKPSHLCKSKNNQS